MQIVGEGWGGGSKGCNEKTDEGEAGTSPLLLLRKGESGTGGWNNREKSWKFQVGWMRVKTSLPPSRRYPLILAGKSVSLPGTCLVLQVRTRSTHGYFRILTTFF